MSKIAVLLPENINPPTRRKLEAMYETHFLQEAADRDQLLADIGGNVRALARGNHIQIGRPLIERLENLEIIATFGVGYDGIDLDCARARGIVVTNTPDVLNEEVADYAIGLLIMTLRDLIKAEHYLRDGLWKSRGPFPPTPGSLRGRTVGIVGLGRIGEAIARRLDAMKVPVVYHGRNRRTDVPYTYYPDLREMAAAVDTLIVVVPGGEQTRKLVDARVLEALGSRGVLINIGRGSAVDEPALIAALRSHTIQAAGLDVYADEPNVPETMLELENIVLLPHVGSASMYTHEAMGQLLIDNLRSWFEQGKPLTPVPETPWPNQEQVACSGAAESSEA